ncbi:hypothetical protein D3C78_1759970 [compost metagenome]
MKISTIGTAKTIRKVITAGTQVASKRMESTEFLLVDMDEPHIVKVPSDHDALATVRGSETVVRDIDVDVAKLRLGGNIPRVPVVALRRHCRP